MKAACAVGEKCCLDPDDGVPYCGANNECLPTLTFPHFAGVTDEMFENICEGKSNSYPNSLLCLRRNYAKYGNNIFEYNGADATGQTETAANRRNAGCGGASRGGLACAARPLKLNGVNVSQTVAWNCDEFPMAALVQGGTGAAIRCVPARLNGFYGTLWQWFLSAHGYRKGLKMRIKITGCDYTEAPSLRGPIPKRAEDETVLASHGDLTVFSSNMFGGNSNGSNVVVIPLTADGGGSGVYTLDYRLTSGTIVTGSIMDEDGQTYETLDSLATGSSSTSSFTLGDSANGNVFFLGLTKDKDVRMDYTVKAPESTSSVGPSATATTGIPKSGAMKDWTVISDAWTQRGLVGVWILGIFTVNL
ncbi:hypothetical protein K505DRAFT_368174 [Melanomma pulvis-pyrius CBS 109.77]|uniref:Deoxyribonuclease NucA/NucB domain-containing protein n=1 Tax=Melanomma pulvis-pyrius CBS 109.77 TaxID=1314802 RepID=A0A6A6WQY8_9PLEO|nr:hypothetical protein K505DRAFT_368174 [Melanomma pulvis-pyrius CBS 109.77]